MKEIMLERIAYVWNNPPDYWIILKEKDNNRKTFICIGYPEATAIYYGLKSIKVQRPMTHHLLLEFVNKLGGRIKKVILTNWDKHEGASEGTFYANIIVECNGVEQTIDSRPSDAIALAVMGSIPIFAEDVVLDLTPVEQYSGMDMAPTLWLS